MPPSTDPTTNTLLQTIAAERRNLEGAKAVIRACEASSRNEAVIMQAQNEVRASQATITFLEAELAKLQMGGGTPPVGGPSAQGHQQSNSMGGHNGGSNASHSGPSGPGQQHSQHQHSNARGPGPDQFVSPPPRGSSSVQPLNIVKTLPPPPTETGAEPKKEQKNYTQLDLLRYDAPLTGAKITRMLNQLQFKLQVEEQYKLGSEKMAQAYRLQGDRRLLAETDAKRLESDGKIQLLRKAKRRYETLAKFGAVDDDDDLIPDAKRKDALRKPISGKLLISLRTARDLNHRAGGRKGRGFETTVVIKIEGMERAVSHASRGDRWLEDFDIPVEKANEVELTIYDTIAPGDSAPIGMFWFRVSDLLEALRRQKVQGAGAEAGPGWVTADKAASMGTRQGAAPESATLHQTAVPGAAHGGMLPGGSGGKSEGIEGWFSVEPAGAILLRIDFVKDTAAGGRRPYEALGRQGALRKRKGDVHEMNGHKFVQRQFYQPIMCALCSEFLLTGEGYQCEDCRYACHKKCYPRVVTKCISKSNADGDGDEEKINHRIPHRFQPYTNVGANWCCHCGYMLPFGRKNSVKCSECALTCHQSCSHLVPDFCGMTMEMANTLLKNLRDIKTVQGTKRPVHQQTLPAQQSSTYLQQPQPLQHTQSQNQPARTSYNAPETRVSPTPPQLPHSQSYNDYDYSSGRPSSQSSGSQQPQSGGHTPRHSFDSRPQLEINTNVGGTPSTTGPLAPPRPQQAQQQQQQAGGAATQSGYRPPAPAPAASMPVAQPTGGRHSMQPPPQQLQQQHHHQQHSQYQPPAAVAPPVQQLQQQIVRKHRKIGLDDFNFLAVLGKGNFGKVMLAEERKSNNLYAIKVLKKEFIIENDEVESTQSEKRVFLAAAQERHPFLLGLHSCFQTETRVYFVMEYVSGGDLMLHIQRRQFTLRQAKFYACEVLLALQYFHTKGIIYRDLKLDNILLTLDGHVKVADYGLCKEEMWYGKTTTTFCGTPEFMAPEILQEQPYGRAVDWWAFGVLTYEMLLGQSPFRGDDEDEIFDAILEDEPLYPLTMPKDAVSLLTELLTRDPKRRLGAGDADAEEIKRHAFFSDVNFDDVYNKRIPPPYFPTIGNATDTSNFDQEFTREQPTLTPVHTQLTAQDQQEFVGFSWIAPWAQ